MTACSRCSTRHECCWESLRPSARAIPQRSCERCGRRGGHIRRASFFIRLAVLTDGVVNGAAIFEVGTAKIAASPY